MRKFDRSVYQKGQFLGSTARVLGAMDGAAFERKVAEARDGVFPPRCREAEILQSFEVAYETIRQRKAAGGPAFKHGPWAMTDNVWKKTTAVSKA